MVEYIKKGNRGLDEFGIKSPLNRTEMIKVKAKVEKTIEIDDGKHEGEITEIIYKTEPYDYVDIVIKENKLDIELKCGVPFNVTANTALGQMLERFGADLKVGEDIEIDDILKTGTKVQFMTLTEKTKKGTFARIVTESLKPVK